MYKKPSWGRRLRYAFDNSLAGGPVALIGWLALATFLLIVLAITVDLVTGGVADQAGLGPREVIWNIVFQALVPNPPGNLDSPWQFLVVMLVVTIASLAMVSILIGLLSATIQDRIETLRRGRSPIVEHNHVVILGWSEQMFTLISELVIASAHQRSSTIALLGDRDQVEMESDIRHRIKSTGRTRVVCRRGISTEHDDLDLVSPQSSRSIIILPNDNEPYPDATTIKTILALTKAPNRRPEPYRIVAMLRMERNKEIAQLVGGDEVELMLSGDLIARIIAQTCRQAGLSSVYTELLDFSGDEIHLQSEPLLVGKTFAEALTAYEDSALMGILPQLGVPLLNPPMDTIIQAGDQIIAISEDSDTIRLSGLAQVPIQIEAIETRQPSKRGPERTLILGWNWRGSTIIRQLDAYVAPGSIVMVVSDHDLMESAITTLQQDVHHQKIAYQSADSSSRHILDSVQVTMYDHIIILCYSDDLDNQRADARTLITLLHLRRIADDHDHTFSIVTEMMDVRNRNLAESTRADDFIVSDRLISLMMAQISENWILNAIFNDLLDPAGSEIFLKPAANYVQAGTPVSFYTVVEAARRHGEIALGYRLHALEAAKNHAYGVVLNPNKSVPVTFAPGDCIIVLAEA